MIPVEYFLIRKDFMEKELKEIPCVTEGTHGGQHVYRFTNDIGKRFEFGSKSKYYRSAAAHCNKRKNIKAALAAVNRRLNNDYRRSNRSSLYQVINTDYHLDGTWYDSLEDSSCGHENNTKYYYNGRHYRSRSEMDIAVVLDEFGLEFKYDVKVKFNGMIFTVDFVIYFREFNRCVILEYYGRCAVPSYNEKNITKIRNSLIDGIYIGRDMFILSGDAEYTPSIPVIRAYVSSIIEMVCHYHIRS